MLQGIGELGREKLVEVLLMLAFLVLLHSLYFCSFLNFFEVPCTLAIVLLLCHCLALAIALVLLLL